MAGDWEAAQARMRAATRQASDGLLRIGRELVEARKTGMWREGYAAFAEYVDKVAQVLPGRARELVRVQRKLEALGIDAATAEEIGWEKLQAVSSRLNAENRDAMLEDLKAETIETLRAKYCPRTLCHSRRQTSCAPQEPACREREIAPDCCATGPERSPAQQSASSASRTGQLVDGAESGERTLEVTPFFEVALVVARRKFRHCSDSECLDAICAIFITLMGSESEKQWVTDQARAELEMRRNREARAATLPTEHTSAPEAESEDDVAAVAEGALSEEAASKGRARQASRSRLAALRRKKKQQRQRRRR